MTIKKIAYSEYEGTPKNWVLESCDFAKVNLIVGKNASGKSRVVNVVTSMCDILSGRRVTPFTECSFYLEVELSGKIYSYQISFKNLKVLNETLRVNNEVRLQRNSDGTGEIYYEQEKRDIKFKVDESSISIQQNRDDLQHPFVAELAKWAIGCQTYFFGSSMGRDILMRLSTMYSDSTNSNSGRHGHDDDLTRSYSLAYERFGEPLDKAILKDMKSLGYQLTDVGSDDLRKFLPGINISEPIIGMLVLEKGLDIPIPQIQMSQGMYRALALIIHINIANLEKRHTMFLIDDIGEGLDYHRSTNLIDLLIKHAKKSGIQLLMTTNDRFVMNRVPLEFWGILRRKKNTVKIYTEQNSPQEYSEFKYMGLSNFDLFSSGAFE